MNLKKLLAFMLALCMVFSLAACGGDTAPAEETTAAEAPVEEVPAEPDEEPVVEEPVEEEPADSQYEQALSLIDGSVEELYDTVGFPVDYMYADSCLGEGEDGELYYDGFTVYTYRDLEDNETIYDVMEN